MAPPGVADELEPAAVPAGNTDVVAAEVVAGDPVAGDPVAVDDEPDVPAVPGCDTDDPAVTGG